MRMDVLRRLGSLRSSLASFLAAVTFLLIFVASSSQSSFAIAAFARKYGLPCSACHDAWPKLNNFGQTFKDNGYQLMNDRDAPIWQNPSYWPVAFRITPNWDAETTQKLATDQAASGYQQVTIHGFNLTGLDILTAGTLNKDISFLLVPSADETGAFHFESAWVRFDNMFHSSWANLKFGKMELDNLISEKRILTLSPNGGYYQFYHFLPFGDANPYQFGIGDNQLGIEFMGHSKNDYTRFSAAVLSSNDGNVDVPYGSTYDANFTFSTGFNAGSLGFERIGAQAYIGQAPTYYLTSGGADIPGTGRGNKTFSREAIFALLYFKKFDVTPMFGHGQESSYLANYTPSTIALPAGSHSPSWNNAMVEAHYIPNPQLIFTYRYDAIYMQQQANDAIPSDAGNTLANTVGFRYYPFMTSRAGFAIHGEYSRVNQKHVFSTATSSLLDQSYQSVFAGMDFIF
jgi:hypothetical protein